MNCKEAQEKITPYIDGELSKDQRLDLEKHILSCNSCYYDFRVESFTKKLVTLKYKRSEVPSWLKDKILNQISSHRKKKFNPFSYLIDLSKSYRVEFAWAVIIIVLSLFLVDRILMKSTPIKEEQPAKMMEMILHNYQKIRSNQFPQSSIFTSNTNHVKEFIISHGFNDLVIPETSWKLVGAGIEKFNDMKVVHFLFKCNDNDVYVMEMDVNEFRQKYNSVVMNSLFEQMKNTKYTIIGRDSCKVVMTMKGSTLVSHVIRHENKEAFEELIAALE